jgi:hypothetical protein
MRLLACLLPLLALQAQDLPLRFAAIGDTGTGKQPQFEVAQQLDRQRPLALVLMLGDNIYGGNVHQKFELPYKPLLDAGVPFYAALGNHDSLAETRYHPFHMEGRSYYAFQKGPVHFFVLDSNRLDSTQLAWLDSALAASRAPWKVVTLHHPLYSSARFHGSATHLRPLLEPLFQKYKVQLVLSGHDHVYERVKPQKGVLYIVEGASGQLRAGNLKKRSPLTAIGFDTDRSFLVFEATPTALTFQAISRAGKIVDSGSLP